MSISAKPASGMRDFLPEETTKRHHALKIIQQTYEKYGFVPLETPSIENLTTLLGKYGDEGDQLIFKILHRRDKLKKALEKENPEEKDLTDLGLRYDLTVSLARVVANNPKLPKYFKRYQMQPVWRADRPGKGRYREFMQCDIDITGTESLVAEAEVCTATAEALQNLGFENFYICINHRQLLKAAIEISGIPSGLETAALVAMDKLDKIGSDGVKDELLKKSITSSQAENLFKIAIRPEGLSEEEEIARLENEISASSSGKAALEEVKTLMQLMSATKAAKLCKVDPSLARGLGYYTGCIFEIRSDLFSGSLGGGGRYDGLVGMFKGEEIPAVGFSIGFERIIMLMDELNLFGKVHSGPDIMLCSFPDVPLTKVIKTAGALRSKGFKVEIYPEQGHKLGRQISYADTASCQFAGIIGSEEAASESLTVKNLKTGEQKNIKVSDADKEITL
ncbi:MAG: histidine--tRNA ligase [Candidatus Riflebacteria bacterium]|nr:histidine--tRNA ligase [Candidatus Riflebacteria bacterium]